jgi:DNA (cytosine-5)-methyltransferase 1
MLRMLQIDELRLAVIIPSVHRFERGNRRDKIMLIGNGVCPPVMQAVIQTIAEP